MKKRILYFDLLNIVASFCVVAMHCNGIVHTYSDSLTWKSALVVESAAYWAVPIFFMLSGATQMEFEKKYSTRQYLEKRFKRTGIPFLVWSILAIAYQSVLNGNPLPDRSPRTLINSIVNTRIENVYWFFIPLFSVYLSMPILSAIKRAGREYLWYFLIFGFGTYSILPFLFQIVGLEFNQALSFPMAGGYVAFAVWGYLLSTTRLEKRQRILIYLGGVIGLFSRFFGTLLLSSANAGINKLFWGYLNWPSVLLATAVFVWFQYQDWGFLQEHSKIQKGISALSGASFGVYLTHMLVIRVLGILLRIPSSDWRWRTMGIVLVYGCAFLLVKGIQKIPVLKKIIP